MKKNAFQRIVGILLLFILPALLTACSPGEGKPAEGAFCFSDALGRELRLSKKPERVAALLGSFAEVWLLAGGSLCAAAEDAWDDFGLELPGALDLGGAHSPNPELLLSAEPDLVIASASSASHVALLELLEAAGIPVAFFDVDNFEEYLAMLEICCSITGREDLYAQNGLSLQTRIEEIRALHAALALPEEERSVLLLRASSGFVKAKGSEGSILGEMLADLSCINIADSDSSLLENLSVEAVIRQEPRHIFVVTMGRDSEQAMQNLQQMMEENPAWGSLRAVSEGRLHLMERRLFHNKPNARWAESYEKLSALLLDEE
ncbi:MAG: ABC transporter substrate-binding protein [Bacillota bacterium]|nr:ABC transporter substrate-binding protein [Bacillota bacterium]